MTPLPAEPWPQTPPPGLGGGKALQHHVEVVDRASAQTAVDHSVEAVATEQHARLPLVETDQRDGGFAATEVRVEVVVEGPLDDRFTGR